MPLFAEGAPVMFLSQAGTLRAGSLVFILSLTYRGQCFSSSAPWGRSPEEGKTPGQWGGGVLGLLVSPGCGKEVEAHGLQVFF